jgi:HEAT repeat protein
MSRRALLIAPTYDGVLFRTIPGATKVLDRLQQLLETTGGYDVRRLEGDVDEAALRGACRKLFESDGETFLYFYGHGIVRPPGLTVLCRSHAREDDEGFLLSELLRTAERGVPREVVLMLDCCHAGQLESPTGIELLEEARRFISNPGRVFIACSGPTQSSHIDPSNAFSSRFTQAVVDGLSGAGRLPGTDYVSASSLFEHILNELDDWDQSPVALRYETGERRCRLVTLPSPPAPPAPPVSPPNGTLRLGLPFSPSATFVGREAELEFLRAYLCNSDRPLSLAATVEGLGGIGKTELVLQLVHDEIVSRTFPTVLWFDASAPLEPQWEYFASRLGIADEPVDGRSLPQWVAAARQGQGRILVVLDNASRWDEVEAMVPKEVALIVTTRSKTFGDSSFIHQDLATLSEDPAVEFLAALLPDAERSSLQRLAERLDGHPLALEIAGHYIRDTCTPQEYIAQLDERAEIPAETAAERTHHGATLESCLQIAWDGMETDAARWLWIRASLFAPISAHRDLLRITSTVEEIDRYLETSSQYQLREARYEREGGIPAHLIDAREFDSAYRELRSTHVLSRVAGHNGERWAMHRLVRDFGRKRLGWLEVELHAEALSGWLVEPTLPVEPEAPHVISAILDLPRFGGSRDRDIGRELLHRGRYRSRPLFGQGLMRFLGQSVSGPHAVSLIFEGIADVNEDVRIEAIRLLDEMGPVPAAVDALAGALDDPSPVVRDRAARTIARHGTDSTFALLESVIGRSDRATLNVLTVLGLLGDRRPALAAPALRSAFGRLSGTLKMEAAIQLGAIGDDFAADYLLTALEEERDYELFLRVQDAFSKATEAGDPRLAEAMSRQSQSPTFEIAVFGSARLAADGDVAAAERLLEHLRERSAEPPPSVGLTAAIHRVVEYDPALAAGIARAAPFPFWKLETLASMELVPLREAARDLEARQLEEHIDRLFERRKEVVLKPGESVAEMRAVRVAAALSRSGIATEHPADAFARVHAAERETGSSDRVAESRAKAERYQVVKQLLERDATEI